MNLRNCQKSLFMHYTSYKTGFGDKSVAHKFDCVYVSMFDVENVEYLDNDRTFVPSPFV